MITTCQVIPLRPRGPTLTLLRSRQVLEPSGQLFDLPAPVTGLCRHGRRQGLLAVLGHDPVKGALWGDPLEEPPGKRDFLHLDEDPRSPPGGRPFEVLHMAGARLFTQTHPAVALQGGEEGSLAAVNDLELLCRGVPAVKPDRARLNLLLVERVDNPLLEMDLLGLALKGGRRHARVTWIKRLLLAPLCTTLTPPIPRTTRGSLPLDWARTKSLNRE
jgi:hypothetical protein